MKRYATGQIRNVALVGHGGSGKTSLAEALLHRAGAINRMGRVEDGTTVCDFDPEEQKRGISLSLSVAPFEWRDHKINLVDTPGYADFMGDVSAALRIADLAVFVVSAVDGVEVQTEEAWELARRLGVPRMVFVNKLDRERASYDTTLAQLRDRLGSGIAPLELPIGEEAAFRGIADLLTDTAHIYENGVPHTEPIPDEMEQLEHQVHDNLVEGIVVADDALLERYLEGDVPSVEELERTLHDGIAAATVFPVLVGSATREVGIDRLADFLVEIGPSPADRPVPITAPGNGEVPTEVEVSADPSGDPLAFVFKTIADPYVGQVSLFRVVSGTLRPDDHLVNSRTGGDERLHGLLMVRGKEQEPASELVAGDIGAVAKLSGTATGDTLAPRGKPVRVPPIEQPAPTLAVAVVPRTQADEDRLAPALHRLVDEDPALRVERVDETHQTLLHGTGETHLQITLEKLTRKFGANVDTAEVRVPYRETITGSAKGVEGRHKKQTGGHGQFGVCVIDIEPLPRGEGFEFASSVVGGAISRGYIPAIQKGIEEAMGAGGVYGYPVVDVKVTVTDGKEHSVDSSEMAFKVAGRLAFRAGMAQANPVILEPISRLEVTVPVALQGDVMGDLNAKRGRVQGTDSDGDGRQTIIALVPTSEIQRYAIELRSLTGGRGRFRAEHDHYDVLPTHLVDAVRREMGDEA
ncbi:MAG TPA: elongation factor G [Acidimicrobiales bacterium]|nr:elongation factor G [Acidimicrobiales bacterium]